MLVCAVAGSWLFSGGFDFLSMPGVAKEVTPPIHSGTVWARYLAPEGTCRGDNAADGSHEDRLWTMRCLLDWARRERGVSALTLNPVLSYSATLKASEIVRCNDFSHTPCGMPFEQTFRIAGYRDGATGENIVWGESLARTPRVLMDSWLHSTRHRENLFRVEWREQGLAVLETDEFLGRGPAAIYVHQFGD